MLTQYIYCSIFIWRSSFRRWGLVLAARFTSWLWTNQDWLTGEKNQLPWRYFNFSGYFVKKYTNETCAVVTMPTIQHVEEQESNHGHFIWKWNFLKLCVDLKMCSYIYCALSFEYISFVSSFQKERRQGFSSPPITCAL